MNLKKSQDKKEETRDETIARLIKETKIYDKVLIILIAAAVIVAVIFAFQLYKMRRNIEKSKIDYKERRRIDSLTGVHVKMLDSLTKDLANKAAVYNAKVELLETKKTEYNENIKKLENDIRTSVDVVHSDRVDSIKNWYRKELHLR